MKIESYTINISETDGVNLSLLRILYIRMYIQCKYFSSSTLIFYFSWDVNKFPSIY